MEAQEIWREDERRIAAEGCDRGQGDEWDLVANARVGGRGVELRGGRICAGDYDEMSAGYALGYR